METRDPSLPQHAAKTVTPETRPGAHPRRCPDAYCFVGTMADSLLDMPAKTVSACLIIPRSAQSETMVPSAAWRGSSEVFLSLGLTSHGC